MIMMGDNDNGAECFILHYFWSVILRKTLS